jgi:hypothetical protein
MTFARVVTRAGKALLRPGPWLTAAVLDGEVGHVPARNELAQRCDPGMLRELPQRVDRDQVRRLEGDLPTRVLLVGTLPADRPADALLVVQKPERLATLATPPLQPLGDDDRCPPALVHGQVIGDDRESWLSVFDRA